MHATFTDAPTARRGHRHGSGVQIFAAFGVAVMLAGTPAAVDAVTAARCARKCTYQIGQCVVQHGAERCGSAFAAPCLQALDQECQQTAVGECLASKGRTCKRRPCSDWRIVYCPCRALGLSSSDCHVPQRCRRHPVECPTITLCCTIQAGPICVVAGQETCAGDDPTCAAGFRAACPTGTVQEIPNGLTCAAVTGCQ